MNTLEKFRNSLAEAGLEKTPEEAKRLFFLTVKFIDKMRYAPQEEIDKIQDMDLREICKYAKLIS